MGYVKGRRGGRGGKGTHKIFHTNNIGHFTNHHELDLVNIFAKLTKNLRWWLRYYQEKKWEASLSVCIFSRYTEMELRWPSVPFSAFVAFCSLPVLGSYVTWSLNVCQVTCVTERGTNHREKNQPKKQTDILGRTLTCHTAPQTGIPCDVSCSQSIEMCLWPSKLNHTSYCPGSRCPSCRALSGRSGGQQLMSCAPGPASHSGTTPPVLFPPICSSNA